MKHPIVPFFIFNDKYGISGAQEALVLSDTLRKIHQEMEADKTINSSLSCDLEREECL